MTSHHNYTHSHTSTLPNMTGPNEQQSTKDNITTPPGMHNEEPSESSPERHAKFPEPQATTQASEEPIFLSPVNPTNSIVTESTDKKPSRSSLQPFLEFLNDQILDPAMHYQTGENFAAVDGSAYCAPETFTDVADMSAAEFEQLFASAPTFFPEDLINPFELVGHGGSENAPKEHVNQEARKSSVINVSPSSIDGIFASLIEGQEGVPQQPVDQALSESLVTQPNQSLEALSQSFVPMLGGQEGVPCQPAYQAARESLVIQPDQSREILDEIFGPMPGAFDEPNTLAETFVDVTNFANLPQDEPERIPTVSSGFPTPLLPVQQDYYPAPTRVYSHLPDDTFGLPGQYSYPFPLQSSNTYTQQYINVPSQPHSYLHSKQPNPQTPLQSYPPPSGWSAIPVQGSHPALADPNFEPYPAKSQARASTSSTEESSPDHPVVERKRTLRAKLPKSLASNYYRIYKEEQEKVRKAREANEGRISARTEKILAFNPEEHYAPLKRPPKPWDIFEYTDQGELQTNTYYTAVEIRRYLYNNPQHQKKGIILWIQRKPADSGRRYPNYASQRCRFHDCPARGNLIGSGQYRVAFDQMSTKGKNYDPHFNAGYVHLYCLERFLDFPEICQRITVRAEDRLFPEEPKQHNNMALSLKEEVEFANFFIANCAEGRVPPKYPRYNMRDRPHEGTLTCALSHVKLQYEPRTAAKRRQERGTKTALENHKGDLVVETALSSRLAAVKKGEETKRAKQRNRKRDNGESDTETESPGEDSEADSDRPRKRQKRRHTQSPQAESVDPLAGPMTRAKKRSVDEASEEPSLKRRN